MLILHDSPSTDLSHVQAIADLAEGFALFDYVRIEQPDGRGWVGQIVQPNQNVSVIGQRLDPTILHGLELMQRNLDVQSVRSVQVFDILVLGQLEDGQMLTPRLRPLPGAQVARLGPEDTAAFISIPAPRPHADGSTNVIGELLNAADVPLCMANRLLNYHIMVAGGTGSGKSNVAANLIDQAVRFRKCVLVHDAKPDYRLIQRANTDDRVGLIWRRFARFGLTPRAANHVTRIGFCGNCDPANVDRVVGFQCSDFGPDMLAGLFFPRAAAGGEEKQYEGFAAVAYYFWNRKRERQINAYTLDEILNEVARRGDPNQNQAMNPSDRLHDTVANAIARKVGTRRRFYPWLDAVGQALQHARVANPFAGGRLDPRQQRAVEVFDYAHVVAEGGIVVLDYGDMDETSYAVILSYFLRECQRKRKRREGPGIVQMVDEAHRIFDNESRHSATLASAFERVMREGRSIDHSVILSLQNASQIPPRVMNNLNTKFVMRQNSKSEAESATQTMGREFATQAMRLGQGHALVSVHESRAVVLAQMAPSPYELLRAELEIDVDGAPPEDGDDEEF